MRSKSLFLGTDDNGNPVWLITIWHDKDPDAFQTYIHTEWTY